jgi:hypothetical protein
MGRCKGESERDQHTRAATPALNPKPLVRVAPCLPEGIGVVLRVVFRVVLRCPANVHPAGEASLSPLVEDRLHRRAKHSARFGG